nr:MAG TPA: hypothetical protein [Caudoviricetes sp.]
MCVHVKASLILPKKLGTGLCTLYMYTHADTCYYIGTSRKGGMTC